MTTNSLALLCAGIAIIAFLYSSVGHAGASGYIAVMTLFGLTNAVIRPSALVLNILVATLTSWQFWRAGHFSWNLFWPFAVTAAPLAFWGGTLNLPTHLFKILVGVVLLFSAFRFLFHQETEESPRPPANGAAMGIGAGLGLLSGLTGTGGGIFLTPLLIFMRWATTKNAAAVSALFILVNSISGLLGQVWKTGEIPFAALPMTVSALAGGLLGGYSGSRQFSPDVIKKLLAIVLIIAGIKLLLT